MPRRRKPARLYWRNDEQQWVIRDGSTQKRTGFGKSQYREAEEALGNYLATRALPKRTGPAEPAELTVGEVLARYADDRGAELSAPETLAYSIMALAPFWGDKTCSEVKKTTCRSYNIGRNKAPGTVRRELGVLQAALNHAHEEAMLVHPIKVTLPQAGAVRERWLTTSEVARLLYHAAPHVRRFIVLSIYTGRRAGAILDLTWTRVDLENKLIRFREDGEAETNKRRGRVNIPRQLFAHICRWQRVHDSLPIKARGQDPYLIMFRGRPVRSIKKGIIRAAERAELSGVTPHVLKHTAITWPIMNGLGLEQAAEYFDTSPATIRQHYWHHSPKHQAEAKSQIERRGR